MTTVSSKGRKLKAACTLYLSGYCAFLSQPTRVWCDCQWAQGLFPLASFDGDVTALAVFDDGTGPALYAGGDFTIAGGVPANHIAKWDGKAWSPLGSGLGGDLSALLVAKALAVFDDGTGSALFAAGGFTAAGGIEANGIAKWNGKAWSPLGSGLKDKFGGPVTTLAVYDDGKGPALYAGGFFTTAGDVAANQVAKWDGKSWTSLGSRFGGVGAPRINSLVVFDNGNGPALYAGGYFKNITGENGGQQGEVAKWDGTGWSTLGQGIDPSSYPEVFSLVVYDAGGGPALYAGGNFGIATWDGGVWSSIKGLEDPLYHEPPIVNSLAVFDAGGGPALYEGSGLAGLGNIVSNFIARLDGGTWAPLESGLSGAVRAFAVFDDGTGPALYMGGAFTGAGDTVAYHIARWDGRAWSSAGTEANGSVNGEIRALTVLDDGTGPVLFAGGSLETAGSIVANGIAKWNGSTWTDVGGGFSAPAAGTLIIHALAVQDKDPDPVLYAGGLFSAAGGMPAKNVARWDGTSWAPLGSGLEVPNGGAVQALSVFDDGTGAALYAGGRLLVGEALDLETVARWDGTAWKRVGRGSSRGTVYSLTVFDDGAGPALYAAGELQDALNQPVPPSKWNGRSWTRLGANWSAGTVIALKVFDDGRGPALYAGGWFTLAAGNPRDIVTRWDGKAWASVGHGTELIEVSALTVHDDGSGPALYAAGFPSLFGGSPRSRVVRLDGESWIPQGGGLGDRPDDAVFALAAFDDGNTPALYAGGRFKPAAEVVSMNLAKWSCSVPMEAWLRCDANGDRRNDIADAVFTLDSLFQGGSAPACPLSADCNQDGKANLSDAVFDLSFLFLGGPPPAPPYPGCDHFVGCALNCP